MATQIWKPSSLPPVQESELLGIDDRLGTIEEGKIADLVLVEGDPSRISAIFGGW
ncbi:MAG: amidohydrolase family protein [Bacteroidales bacterium]